MSITHETKQRRAETRPRDEGMKIERKRKQREMRACVRLYGQKACRAWQESRF